MAYRVDCLLTEQLRRSTWPTETTLEAKLWGTRQELHSTASFIEQTCIKVKDLGMRKMTAEEEEILCIGLENNVKGQWPNAKYWKSNILLGSKEDVRAKIHWVCVRENSMKVWQRAAIYCIALNNTAYHKISPYITYPTLQDLGILNNMQWYLQGWAQEKKTTWNEDYLLKKMQYFSPWKCKKKPGRPSLYLVFCGDNWYSASDCHICIHPDI